MKCKECLKELNEMTLYCDRCGAQLSKEKLPLTFEVINESLLPIAIETPFGRNHSEEIRNAYFLSNIRKDFRGFKRRYIDQYIDYILLRTYYLKNKAVLTTTEFDPSKALSLLQAFENRKITEDVYNVLKEEYADDYENRVIPKSITDRVEKVFLSDYNLKNLSPSKFALRIFLSTLVGMIKFSIGFGVIGVAVYYVLQNATGFNLLQQLLAAPNMIVALLLLLFLAGFLISRRKREFYPFEDIINNNIEFKKHIRVEVKKRSKVLKYRIKKNRKNKKE